MQREHNRQLEQQRFNRRHATTPPDSGEEIKEESKDEKIIGLNHKLMKIKEDIEFEKIIANEFLTREERKFIRELE